MSTDLTLNGSGVDPADANGDDAFVKTPETAAAAAGPVVVAAPAPLAAAAPSAPEEPEIAPLTESEYDQAISLLGDRVKQTQALVKQAQAACDVALGEQNAVISEKARAYPPLTHSQQVKAHLAREAARRLARVSGANSINDAAGQKVVPINASPIDAGMARRPRGG